MRCLFLKVSSFYEVLIMTALELCVLVAIVVIAVCGWVIKDVLWSIYYALNNIRDELKKYNDATLKNK